MNFVFKSMIYGFLEIGKLVLLLAAFFAICGLAMLPIWLAEVYSWWWLAIYALPFLGFVVAVGSEQASREEFESIFYDDP